jgi:hypothetical protein
LEPVPALKTIATPQQATIMRVNCRWSRAPATNNPIIPTEPPFPAPRAAVFASAGGKFEAAGKRLASHAGEGALSARDLAGSGGVALIQSVADARDAPRQQFLQTLD